MSYSKATARKQIHEYSNAGLVQLIKEKSTPGSGPLAGHDIIAAREELQRRLQISGTALVGEESVLIPKQ